MKKIETICVDTLTAIQVNSYMADKQKPGHDQWKDYGQEIYNFMSGLQERGFEIVLILLIYLEVDSCKRLTSF